jgi:hypothetical protein
MPVLMALAMQLVTHDPPIPVLMPPPLPGTEWAIGKTLDEIRPWISAAAVYGPITWPSPNRTGEVDIDLPLCRLFVTLRYSDRGPVIDSILPTTATGGLVLGEEQATCFAALRPKP